MTIEKVSEIVQSLRGIDKIELFCYFEERLNPHQNRTSIKSIKWQEMFALLCGLQIAIVDCVTNNNNQGSK